MIVKDAGVPMIMIGTKRMSQFTMMLVMAVLAVLTAWSSPTLAQANDPLPDLLDLPFRDSLPPTPDTTIPKRTPSPPVSDNKPDLAELALTALSSEGGQAIDEGLIWRVFAIEEGSTVRPRIVATSKQAQPVFQLDKGDYLVIVSFGRAHATQRVSLKESGKTNEEIPLNVGVLRITAFAGNGTPLPEADVRYDVFSDERDFFGERPKIAGGLKPGTLVRLNSGLYHIVSKLGDSNAIVEANLTVEPGKLSDATIVHHAATITFKLVTRPGGEAIANTQWTIADQEGNIVKRTAGALPTHKLAPGSYVATASSAGRAYRQSFVVASGENAAVEVMAQQ